MLKVLVIDDETVVRRGIVLGVDWAAMGCVVVGEAANGEEGLLAVERYSPNLIITDVRMPSLLNATAARNSAGSRPSDGGTVLMAGSAASSMPVIYLTGEGFARAAPSPGQLQPFGLSDKPLSIEGQVAKPTHLSPVKRYRLFFQPQYLQPRRNLN